MFLFFNSPGSIVTALRDYFLVLVDLMDLRVALVGMSLRLNLFDHWLLLELRCSGTWIYILGMELRPSLVPTHPLSPQVLFFLLQQLFLLFSDLCILWSIKERSAQFRRAFLKFIINIQFIHILQHLLIEWLLLLSLLFLQFLLSLLLLSLSVVSVEFFYLLDK